MSIKISVDGISEHLKKMIERSNLVAGWLNRVAYPKILEVQRMRWASEGNSEGSGWRQLKANYKTYKLKKYADYPGSGTKLLIATNRLVDSMTGKSKAEHWKLVQKNKLEVGSFVPYAAFVDKERDITSLSKDTVDSIAEGLGDYLTKGSMGRIK